MEENEANYWINSLNNNISKTKTTITTTTTTSAKHESIDVDWLIYSKEKNNTVKLGV